MVEHYFINFEVTYFDVSTHLMACTKACGININITLNEPVKFWQSLKIAKFLRVLVFSDINISTCIILHKYMTAVARKGPLSFEVTKLRQSCGIEKASLFILFHFFCVCVVFLINWSPAYFRYHDLNIFN